MLRAPPKVSRDVSFQGRESLPRFVVNRISKFFLLSTFLFLRNLKRAETSLGSHSSKGRREHLRHLHPGLGGLWESWQDSSLPGTNSLDLLLLKERERADSESDHQDKLLDNILTIIGKSIKTNNKQKLSMNSF